MDSNLKLQALVAHLSQLELEYLAMQLEETCQSSVPNVIKSHHTTARWRAVVKNITT